MRPPSTIAPAARPALSPRPKRAAMPWHRAASAGHWWRALAAFCLMAFCPNAPPDTSNTAPVPEDLLKCAWILNFAELTTWSADTFQEPSSPIVFGVVGKNSLSDDAIDSLRGKSAQGRRVVAKRVSSLQDAQSCQILFFENARDDLTKEILGKLNNHPVLTIVDSDEGINSPWIIRFVRQKNKIRFDIDLNQANAAKIKLSPKLLDVAHSVSGSFRAKPSAP